MAFFLNRNSKGYTLIPVDGGGTLNVVSGKAKPASIKAKKDEGTVKKGDTINGIEFALQILDSDNFKPQIFEQGKDGAYGKYIPDLQPLVFPLTATLFVAGECGEAYLALFANVAAFGLPDGIMDGFKANLNIGDNKYTTLLVKGDFKNPAPILMMLFDEAEKVECKIDFPAPFTGNGKGGGGGQPESEKLADRLKFLEAVMTDATPEQIAFVKFVTANGGEVTLHQFASLVFS